MRTIRNMSAKDLQYGDVIDGRGEYVASVRIDRRVVMVGYYSGDQERFAINDRVTVKRAHGVL